MMPMMMTMRLITVLMQMQIVNDADTDKRIAKHEC